MQAWGFGEGGKLKQGQPTPTSLAGPAAAAAANHETKASCCKAPTYLPRASPQPPTLIQQPEGKNFAGAAPRTPLLDNKCFLLNMNKRWEVDM